jgi:hypothetical protein
VPPFRGLECDGGTAFRPAVVRVMNAHFDFATALRAFLAYPRMARAALGAALSLIGLMPLPAAPQPNGVAPPAGLVAWWAGGGTANDYLNAANGTPYGGVTYVSGKVGRCFAFDGISGGINVPDVPALALTNSLTIECWLHLAHAPSVPGMVLFRGDTRSGLDPYYLSVEPRAGTPGFLTFVVWGEENINTSITAPMPIGRWTHVAATLTVDTCAGGSGRMTLYTNAVVAAETNTTIRPLAALNQYCRPGIGIGNHSSQPGPFNYPFRGLIDELSVYDRALSLSEIQAICRAGSAGKSSSLPPR